MEDYIIMGISLVITGIVSLFTYNRLKNKQTKNQKFIEKATRAGCYTSGHYETSKVILGVEGSSNVKYREDKLKVKYKYMVNGISYYKHVTFQSTGRVGTDFPVEIKVYYDPHNPKKAICPQEATKAMQVRSGCMTTIVITIITLIVVFNLLRTILG